MIKEVKVRELLHENNKDVTKEFSGATTDDMKSYIYPTISNDPDCIVLYCGKNDQRQNNNAVEIGHKILELVVSSKSDSNNIQYLELFPVEIK